MNFLSTLSSYDLSVIIGKTEPAWYNTPMHRKPLQRLAVLSTIFFGLNTIIPLSALAQTSGSATVGQTIDASGGALTLPCEHGNFSLGNVDINTPDPFFNAYYMNPKTPDVDLSSCGGTGVTVQDTRYNGGFVLQVAATEYLKDGTGPESIDVDNLAVVTEQISTSYLEDTAGTSTFVGSGDSILAGSTDDNEVNENVEVTQTLPFDFTYYGTTYSSGSTLYVCSNGTINFTSGECDAPLSPPEDIFEDVDGGSSALPRILPYYKDLATDTTIDASYGIFYTAPSGTTARFRWKGAPCVADDTIPTNCEESLGEDVEFEVLLTDNGDEDTITFNYGTITDAQEGPVVGVTKGGTAGTPVTNTYTESQLSGQMQGSDLNNDQAVFTPGGTDFTEVVKPSTPAVVVSANGNPNSDPDYVDFVEDGGNPGNSLNLDLMNGNVDTGCGRVGIYTLYPSYRLQVPQATVDGSYESTITYTLSDSTGPGSGSC